MISSNFINFFMAFLIINILILFVANTDFKNKKSLAFLGYIFSLMIIISICFFPFPFQNEYIEDIVAENLGSSNNFIPFKTIVLTVKYAFVNHVYSEIVYQLLGNIILFMPLGFSLYYYIDKGNRLLKGIILVALTSILIESFQYFFNYELMYNYRSVDIDDFILNVIGGITGFGIASFIHKYKSRIYTILFYKKRQISIFENKEDVE